MRGKKQVSKNDSTFFITNHGGQMSKAYYFSGCEKKKKRKFQHRILYPAKKIPLNEEEINISSNDGQENLWPADLP